MHKAGTGLSATMPPFSRHTASIPCPMSTSVSYIGYFFVAVRSCSTCFAQQACRTTDNPGSSNRVRNDALEKTGSQNLFYPLFDMRFTNMSNSIRIYACFGK
jgi:hypothetical protein